MLVFASIFLAHDFVLHDFVLRKAAACQGSETPCAAL